MNKWLVNNKKTLGLTMVFVILLAAVSGIYLANRPQPTAETKRIIVTVVDAQQQSTSFAITTDAAFLRGALEQQNLIAGEESAYGLFVKTVNGISADDSKQEWWCITQSGESLITGVDTAPIADGDTFEITLTTGY